jgi:hypothetical protein
MSIRRCTPKIAQDQERYYIDWDDDPRGEFVFYCDHISWADHTPEVEAMRAACIAAVEALRGLTDDELLAPRALPETNEEWVARARILAVLREVQT